MRIGIKKGIGSDPVKALSQYPRAKSEGVNGAGHGSGNRWRLIIALRWGIADIIQNQLTEYGKISKQSDFGVEGQIDIAIAFLEGVVVENEGICILQIRDFSSDNLRFGDSQLKSCNDR